MSKIKDISGLRFGKLVAIKRIGSDKLGHSLWELKCDCGNIVTNLSNRVLTGNTKGCGYCNGHGMRYTRIYRTWVNMKSRCYDKNQRGYNFYGVKGIKVCDEWKDNFRNFLVWSELNGYKENLTIDRIDNSGNYCPNNCQWITISENVKKKIISKETREKMSRIRKEIYLRKCQ